MINLKKVAIITYYYKSINYGGNLQAYALCKKLNDMGGNAEQICFDAQASNSFSKRIKNVLRRVVNLFRREQNTKFNKKLYEKREKAFFNFNSILTIHSQ